jgi:hypothetical protein
MKQVRVAALTGGRDAHLGKLTVAKPVPRLR